MGQSANNCRKIPTWQRTLQSWVATTSMSELNFRCMLSYDWRFHIEFVSGPTVRRFLSWRDEADPVPVDVSWAESTVSYNVLSICTGTYRNSLKPYLFPSFLHRSAPAGLWLTIEHVGGPLGELHLSQFAAAPCHSARCPWAQTCHATCNLPQGRVFEEGFSPSDRGLSEEEITAYLPAP